MRIIHKDLGSNQLNHRLSSTQFFFGNKANFVSRSFSTRIYPSGGQNMLWKWTKRLGFGLLGTLTALAVGGAAFQYFGEKLDKKRFPPMGEMVDVGGYRLHLYRTGRGSPTVVLDSGLGGQLLDWALIQPKVAEFTEVVSIDRAGTGASDESPLERTSENMAEELRLALHRAGIYGPYILVGHSFGGLNARVYASKFPYEVAGVVLVDSSHEDQVEKSPSLK